MTNKTFLGIDPGQKGGIASIAPMAEVPLLFQMPKTPRDVLVCLRNLRNKKVLAIIERSQPMPKQGVVSVFSYGVGYGVLIGCLEALDIPYVEIRPQAWKKEMLAGFSNKAAKATSIRVCRRLFPFANLIPPGCRVMQDGLAEALLIAEYGRRKNL